MYHALLSNRYLTSRVIPYIAVAAVAMCVALVIVVVSVMTGFLNMVRDSGRTLMGDVIISYPVTGIPFYEDLMARLEAMDDVEAAAPLVENWGLLKMPYPSGDSKSLEQVQIWGIEPESFARVTGFADTLYWNAAAATGEDASGRPTTVTDEQLLAVFYDAWGKALKTLGKPDLSLDQREAIIGQGISFQAFKDILTPEQWAIIVDLDPRLDDPARFRADGLSLTRNGRPAIVMGIAVAETNRRDDRGNYYAMASNREMNDAEETDWYWWMPTREVTLSTIPVDRAGALPDPTSFIFPIANEFQSGVFVIDDKRVLIPIDIAQEILDLDASEAVSETEFDETGMPLVTGVTPAAATQILIRARPGVSSGELILPIKALYETFWTDHRATAAPGQFQAPSPDFVSVQTWEQYQSDFIGPVEKERELMRTLFMLVYFVCAGLVLSIFWAIVYEKTRDIGILRSIGASRIGISWIFLQYGFVVGTLGAITGVALGWTIIRNINTIHHGLSDPPWWLVAGFGALGVVALVVTILRSLSGRMLPLVLGLLITSTLFGISGLCFVLYRMGGVVIWDPRVYYFSEIPNQIDGQSAVITMIGAVVFSLIGAFIPAAKAADTDPVRALRYE